MYYTHHVDTIFEADLTNMICFHLAHSPKRTLKSPGSWPLWRLDCMRSLPISCWAVKRTTVGLRPAGPAGCPSRLLFGPFWPRNPIPIASESLWILGVTFLDEFCTWIENSVGQSFHKTNSDVVFLTIFWLKCDPDFRTASLRLCKRWKHVRRINSISC